MKIKGKVIYQDLGVGFWGIIGDDGSEWLPVNMPNQLKVKGAEVEIQAIESDQESMAMWGSPIKILSFHTLPRL